MKTNICTFGKLFLLMILVLGVGRTNAQDIYINFGGYHPNAYKQLTLTQEQLDGINYISPITEGWEVASFKVSAVVKGFVWDASSRSGEITTEQRKIIDHTAVGDKVYFEDIYLRNTTTGSLRNVGIWSITKDGICAKINVKGIETSQNPIALIHVYPSLNSPFSDTTRFAVKSFRVETTCPQYAICKTFQGNCIDTIVCEILMGNGFDNCIKEIVCIDKQTQEEFVVNKIIDDQSHHYGTTGVYRSKEYFTKKNAKLDFIYKQDFKIDSIKVEFYNDLIKETDEYTFKGDVFDDKFKKYIRNSVPVYSWINFSIYHSGGQCEGPISVYIVE